jgi:hypothetical protein
MMRKIIACEFMTLDGVIQTEEADGEVGFILKPVSRIDAVGVFAA